MESIEKRHRSASVGESVRGHSLRKVQEQDGLQTFQKLPTNRARHLYRVPNLPIAIKRLISKACRDPHARAAVQAGVDLPELENACDGKQHIMESSRFPRRDALEDAFVALVELALARRRSAAHRPNDHVVPAFSYLLTPKQFDRVRKICKEKGWDVPNQKGILIDLEAVAHPLDARMTKDRCTVAQVVEILLAAYSPYSQIGLNKPKHAQAIVFNTRRKVRIGKASFYAVAVVKVQVEGARKYLAPVTAYHATEAKIRNIS